MVVARLFLAGGLLSLLIACSPDEQATQAQTVTNFEPANTMQENLEHHRKVPHDNHWWAVTGEEMSWLHKNIQQVFPTVPVYRAGQVRELEYELMPQIADYLVQTPEGDIPFKDFLYDDQSTAMGVVILHEGKIVFESYPRMKEYEKVVYWSTSKIFAGTLVRLLEERGLIDVNKPIGDYIPDLAGGSFGDTTVRNYLDHASGIDCEENYEDPESCYYEYSMAIGDNVRNEYAADNPYDYFAAKEVVRLREQGTKFAYSGAHNFILSWLIREVTGHSLQDMVTKELWQHIGAESDAAFFAYRYGIAVSHGGFVSRLRDLARLGLLYTPSYSVVSDKKVISDEFLELLRNGANPNLRWQVANPLMRSKKSDSEYVHSIYQWGAVYDNGTLNQGGWGGQGIMINPEWDVVAVFVSYFKDDYSEVETSEVVLDVITSVFSEVPPNSP